MIEFEVIIRHGGWESDYVPQPYDDYSTCKAESITDAVEKAMGNINTSSLSNQGYCFKVLTNTSDCIHYKWIVGDESLGDTVELIIKPKKPDPAPKKITTVDPDEPYRINLTIPKGTNNRILCVAVVHSTTFYYGTGTIVNDFSNSFRYERAFRDIIVAEDETYRNVRSIVHRMLPTLNTKDDLLRTVFEVRKNSICSRYECRDHEFYANDLYGDEGRKHYQMKVVVDITTKYV